MSDTNKYIEEDGVAYLVEGLKQYADNKLGGLSITDFLNCPRAIFNYSRYKYASTIIPNNTELIETLYIFNSNIDSAVSNNYDQITDGSIIVSGEYLVLLNLNMVIKPEHVKDTTTNEEIETGNATCKLMYKNGLEILEEFNTQPSIMAIGKDIYSSLSINSIAHIYISSDTTHLYDITLVMDSNIVQGMLGINWNLTLIKLG